MKNDIESYTVQTFSASVQIYRQICVEMYAKLQNEIWNKWIKRVRIEQPQKRATVAIINEKLREVAHLKNFIDEQDESGLVTMHGTWLDILLKSINVAMKRLNRYSATEI